MTGLSSQDMTVLVCQYCGRVALRGAEPHWLDEPHREDPDIRVVRCPEHWSEWALRNTIAGRTKAMRARAREAKDQPAPAFPAWLSPYPLTTQETE